MFITFLKGKLIQRSTFLKRKLIQKIKSPASRFRALYFNVTYSYKLSLLNYKQAEQKGPNRCNM